MIWSTFYIYCMCVRRSESKLYQVPINQHWDNPRCFQTLVPSTTNVKVKTLHSSNVLDIFLPWVVLEKCVYDPPTDPRHSHRTWSTTGPFWCDLVLLQIIWDWFNERCDAIFGGCQNTKWSARLFALLLACRPVLLRWLQDIIVLWKLDYLLCSWIRTKV